MKDTIYRQDAIDGADEIIKRDTSGNNDVVKAMEAWKAYINNLPSAERVGKWVERHPMRYDGKFVGADTDIIPDTRIRHLYCGECDKQMPIFEKFPYCPYCGVPMEGVKEE